MACAGPLTAYRSKELSPNGKRGIVFKRDLSLTGIPFELPCGKCFLCRLEYSRQWAVRLMHEKRMHEDSSFVTLTYDDRSIMDDGSLVKSDLVGFCKRLHNRLLRSRGKGIRYYGVGEYGDSTNRPHYHALIFGYQFQNPQYYKTTKAGFKLYVCSELDDLWPYGLHSFGDVTFESAAYCARYVIKKMNGVKAEDHYMGRVPEFSIMSRRPGIAAGYYDRFGSEVYNSDSVVINGREVRPPRFYDLRFEITDAKRLEKLKAQRKRAALRNKDFKSSRRRYVVERVRMARMSLSRRDVG